MGVGCYAGKRRENAVAQALMLAWRLREDKVSHAITLHDLANAFGSRCHGALDAANERSQPHDVKLLNDRHRTAVYSIEAADRTIDIRAGEGAMAGDRVAPMLFNEVYSEAMDEWTGLEDPGLLQGQCPITGHAVRVDLLVYVDDTLRMHLIDDAADLQQKLSISNKNLDDVLEKRTMKQHRSKQEVLPCVVGNNAHRETKKVFVQKGQEKPAIEIEGKVCKDARYLGSRLQANASAAIEVQLRLGAMDKAWRAMGGYWSSKAPRKVKVLLFDAFVHSAGLSGFEAFVLTSGQCKEIDTAVLKMARRILGEKASGRRWARRQSMQQRPTSRSTR